MPDEQLANVLAGIQIHDGIRFDSPLLIAEATGTTEAAEAGKANSLGNIGFGFNLFDDTKLVENANRAIERAITGLALALPAGEFREIETLGSASYVVDPVTSRTVYSLSNTFIKASGSVSTSVTAEILVTAARYATELRADAKLRTVGRLLSQSSLATDNLTAVPNGMGGPRGVCEQNLQRRV